MTDRKARTLRTVTVGLLTLVLLLSLVVVPRTRSPDDGAAGVDSPAAAARMTCDELAAEIADTMQDYVALFEDQDVTGFLALEELPGDLDLEAEIQTFRLRARNLGCETEVLAAALRPELERVRGAGPVAIAVAGMLRSTVFQDQTDRTDQQIAELRVAPEDDLADVAAGAEAGTTLVLDAGDHVLDTTLLLLHRVRLVGAGQERTRILSEAGGAAIVHVGAGPITLQDLSVAHQGDVAADVLVIGGGGFRLRDVHVSGGSTGNSDEGGGGVVAMAQPREARGVPPSGSDASIWEIVDSTVEDNEGGGVTLIGVTNATIRSSRLVGNASCGLCLSGASVRVSSSQVSDNGTGVALGAGSTLDADGLEVRDNATAGMVFESDSGGSIAGSTVAGNGDVGVLVGGTADPRIETTEIVDHGIGLFATERSVPTIEGGRFELNDIALQAGGSSAPRLSGSAIRGQGRVGILIGGQATGEIATSSLSGEIEVAIQIQDAARPALSGNVVTTSGSVGVLYLDEAAGRAEATTVSGPRIGIQSRDDTSPEIRGSDLAGGEQVGMALGGRTTANVVGNRCGDTGVLLLLVEGARPTLSDNRCEVVDQR